MTGSKNNPANLYDVLHSARVQPGDTIYLRGGVYNAASLITSARAGTDGNLIIMQNYPGEQVYIDASLLLASPYVRWFSPDYRLEIIGTENTRVIEEEGSSPETLPGHGGVGLEAIGSELINVRVKNCNGNAVYAFGGGPQLIYGCHLIHNGWIAPDRSHGPGIYTHNSAGGLKTIQNAVIVDSFRYGLQVYSASINRIQDYLFADVSIVGPNIVTGTGADYPAQDNVTFRRLMMYGGHPLIGYYLANRGNYTMLEDSIIWHTAAYAAKNLDDMRVENCKFVDSDVTLIDCTPTTSGNVFGPFTGLDYNLAPNIYAPAFATLTVYNWDDANTVNIDVSAWATTGTIRIHNVILMHEEYQNVALDNGAITVPMTGWTTPPPLGFDGIMTDAYPGEFGVFILEKLA